MKRFVIIAGSLATTGFLVMLALLLGNAGFNARRFTQHENRLKKLLPHEPTLQQIVKGLHDEGTPLLASASNGEDLRRLAQERGRLRQAEIIEKGRRYPEVRVFLAGDMIYFIYFDAGGIMKDFACVSR
ncbi:MAG TPA: hypothetical protein VJU18_01110 [Vicinamibacteria bacterium]|nr:hypothetical protein [Vicinamibacteria bacterium]